MKRIGTQKRGVVILTSKEFDRIQKALFDSVVLSMNLEAYARVCNSAEDLNTDLRRHNIRTMVKWSTKLTTILDGIRNRYEMYRWVHL